MIAQWEHLSFAIFIFDLKRQLKLLTCLIFPLRWACFLSKPSHIAQWEHLFSMDFDDSRPFLLCFRLKGPFSMITSSHSGNTKYMRSLSMKDSTKIELFYFDEDFRRIAQWVLALSNGSYAGCHTRWRGLECHLLGAPTERCNIFRLKRVPIAHEKSDMLDIHRDTFQDLSVDF